MGEENFRKASDGIWPSRVYEFDVEDGDTVVLDCSFAGGPFVWEIETPAGVTVVHEYSLANEPADADWHSPMNHADIAADTIAVAEETMPAKWLRWTAAGGAAKLRAVTNGELFLE